MSSSKHGDHEDDAWREEAERLREYAQSPDGRREALEHLEEGAEVLRRHMGWSKQQLAQHLGFPPDFSGYTEFGTRRLGERFAELRELVGLTPGELAEKAKVPIHLLRVLEEGPGGVDEPSIDELQTLAEALETNLAFMLFWAEQVVRSRG